MSDAAIIGMLSFIIALVALILITVAKIAGVVDGINRKVNMLMKQAGMDVHETAIRDALPLMREGKKIEAIKRYREITGAGLAEAKAAVESAFRENAGPA